MPDRTCHDGRMLDLSLTGLRVLVEVANRGSFTAAAEALAYTQSAVSRQVGVLEQSVGTPLFERQPRGVVPTPAGETLARHAAKVLGHVEAAELELDGLRDRLAGRLVVGAYPTVAATVVPRAMSRLMRRHPDLVLALQEAATPEQLRRLRGGRIEVAVIAAGEGLPDYDLANLRSQVVRTGRGLGIAVRQDHPFAAREAVGVAELADQVWVVGVGGRGEPQFGPWPTLEQPRVGFEARTWPTRLGLVAAGLGISVLPGTAADIVPHNVRWIPVHDPGLAWNRETLLVTNEDPSRNAQAMTRAIGEEFSALEAGG